MTARGAGLRVFETPGHGESSPEPKIAKRPPRALGITLLVAGLGLILDQGTKALATTQLQPGDRVPLIGDLLSLSLVYNPGAAFSIGSGSTWVFTIIGVLAAFVITGFAVRRRGIRWGIALGLILGGAVGNLLDRLAPPPPVVRARACHRLHRLRQPLRRERRRRPRRRRRRPALPDPHHDEPEAGNTHDREHGLRAGHRSCRPTQP